jgi:predicted transcriptional regulator
MRISLAEYHLLQMEKTNFIIAHKDNSGHYKRYYVGDSDIGAEDKKLLSLLRQEICLRIVVYLLLKNKLRHRDLLQNLDIASSTLSFHISKLTKNGIIEINTYGDDKGYSLRNKKKIFRILVEYGLHLLLEDFRDAWKDLSVWN